MDMFHPNVLNSCSMFYVLFIKRTVYTEMTDELNAPLKYHNVSLVLTAIHFYLLCKKFRNIGAVVYAKMTNRR